MTSDGSLSDGVAGKALLALLLAVVAVELVVVVGLVAVLFFTGSTVPVAVGAGMLVIAAAGCLLTFRVARRDR